MELVFRLDLQKRLKDSSHIILELGSGAKKNTERICIDKLNLPHIDIVADLEEGLPFFPDNSVDAIYSKSFLEHVNNLSILMQDIWRVLKPTRKTFYLYRIFQIRIIILIIPTRGFLAFIRLSIFRATKIDSREKCHHFIMTMDL